MNLTVGQISKTPTKPGLLGDGGGLYLQIREQADGDWSKTWVFRYRDRAVVGKDGKGKLRTVGLGPLSKVPLKAARGKAHELRKLLDQGVDPLRAKDAARKQAELAAAADRTFDQCAAEFLADNPKNGTAWQNTLATHVSPVIGQLPVASIDTPHVLKVLKPIWWELNETASRVRSRVETILGYATVHGYRKGDNPARWRNHLALVLPAPADVQQEKPQPALPYTRINEFVVALRQRPGLAARALELLILTAVRSGSLRAATWDEFDLEHAVWTIPADHMKGKKSKRTEFKVPLPARAVEIVRDLARHKQGPYVFPGTEPNEEMSDATLLAVIKRMNGEKLKDPPPPIWVDPKQDNRPIVVHGFRSTFSDWAAEMTAWPRDLREMALAHTIDNKVEAAYRRGDLFEKRRRLMDEWAAYCESHAPASADNVHAIRAVG
ncbi:hypothetical protein B7G54_12030 [Burkholderia puraquae]|uniref:Prophage integrase IntS n=1 Tax=Burkholderia puraquae TaxID=1904757 RepID=A0A1X1PI96_9BURK|nr:site-specific integrase [Burkholderia puraquae]ORT86202.1 hypothetical protein B7G54_12030 [Burkholderia puraquae]CAB3754568.1 Prophage integrase IntS [Burkholderia puraquae]